MKLRCLTCAASVVIDKKTNRLSLFNLFEDAKSASFPAIIPSFTIAALLSRKIGEPQKATIGIRLSFGRKILAEIPAEVDFEDGILHRSIVEVQGLALPAPGVLTATVRHNNKLLGRWEIPISHSEEAPAIKAR